MWLTRMQAGLVACMDGYRHNFCVLWLENKDSSYFSSKNYYDL